MGGPWLAQPGRIRQLSHWFVAAWALAMAGWLIGVVGEHLGFSNVPGVTLFVSGWVLGAVLMSVTGLATVRYGGPFGTAGRGGSGVPRPGQLPPVEFHGAGAYNSVGPQELRVRFGPILSFGRLAFDEHRIGIRNPFMDRTAERLETQCIEVTPRTSVSWFALVGADGRRNRLTFGTRDRQGVVNALLARGWNVVERR